LARHLVSGQSRALHYRCSLCNFARSSLASATQCARQSIDFDRCHEQTLMQHSWEQITNTCPFNITHHPAISLPCGFGEGDRPVGLMLIAKHWQESTLYRVADAFERACNWQRPGATRR
jgi:Asp-tRNA(Asn)/Glu-tRNA(Gln) amidotransferase A subunit family amidase